MLQTPLFDVSPARIALRVAAAARARRVAAGWTRAELAARAGVSVDLLKRFETTGRVTFDKLLRIAVALDAAAPFAALFPPVAPQTLDDLERQAARRGRVYGRRRDAGRPRGRPETARPETADAATPPAPSAR